jgi:hypothetical protein
MFRIYADLRWQKYIRTYLGRNHANVELQNDVTIGVGKRPTFSGSFCGANFTYEVGHFSEDIGRAQQNCKRIN